MLVQSEIGKIFACNDPESGKFLLVMIRNRGKFLLVQSGIEEIFACTIRNRANFCLYNPESGKFFAYGIRNPGFGNPEYVAQEMWNLESSIGRRRFAENTGSHNIFSSNKTIQLIYLCNLKCRSNSQTC